MDFTNYEYAVDKKREGSLKLLTYLLLFSYVAFVGAFFGILYWIRLIPVGATIPIFLWILVFFTWRYVQIDNKYTMESGKLTFERIYGNRTKKVVAEFRMKVASIVAPLKDNEENIKEFAPHHVYNALPSANCDDAYVAFYTDKDGKKCIFLFQATAQALKVFHYYNDKTVVTRTNC